MNKKIPEHWELNKIEALLNEKLPHKERQEFASQILGTIIHILGKYLIRIHGYSTLSTVLKREMRELGKKNARMLKNLFGINETTEENVKTILNIAAIILGLKLGLRDGKKVVAVNCPFYETLKKFNEPFMCNACMEYNNGIVEELIGDKFEVKREKWLFNKDGCCVYGIVRKT
jgi:predicted ArsR family transcriptional regulator